MVINPSEDAFGCAMKAYLTDPGVMEIVERDDGLIDVGRMNFQMYMSSFEDWPETEQKAIAFARGRVLDVGCGPGRCALYLQEQGCDVVGIDASPGMIEVARSRGVKDARLMSLSDVRVAMGKFDSIVMMGNNFGLVASADQAKRYLKRFHRLTTADGRIIGETGDVYKTDNPDHLWYHEHNRQRGRMAGQLRLRIRYMKMKSPWFDYLFLSPDELQEIVAGTGWRIAELFHPGGFNYAFVLKKE